MISPPPKHRPVEACLLPLPCIRLTDRDRSYAACVDESEVARIRDSIGLNDGQVITPVVVRRTEDPDAFELVSGLLRLLGSAAAEAPAIPCIVRDLTPLEARLAALIENAPRRHPPLLRLGWDAADVIAATGSTQRGLAERLWYKEQTLSEALAMVSEVLPLGHAEEIATGHGTTTAALEKLPRRELRRLRKIEDPAERRAAVEESCRAFIAGEKRTPSGSNDASDPENGADGRGSALQSPYLWDVAHPRPAGLPWTKGTAPTARLSFRHDTTRAATEAQPPATTPLTEAVYLILARSYAAVNRRITSLTSLLRNRLRRAK